MASVFKSVGLGVVARETAVVGCNPNITPAVAIDISNSVMRDGTWIGGIINIIAKRSAAGCKPAQAAVMSAEPEITLMILCNGRDVVTEDGGGGAIRKAVIKMKL